MKTKHCPKCDCYKVRSEFSNNKSAYDGLSSWCKLCDSEYQKIYYSSYRDKNKEKLKKYQSLYQKKYYLKNKAFLIKQKIIYHNKRYKEDLEFRLSLNLRNRFNKAVKRNKTGSVLKLIGCSVEFLKNHLESQFVDGMSWDNYGDWHIDHKRPCASFDLSKVKDQRECFHYSNLQPLWAEDNRKKGSK